MNVTVEIPDNVATMLGYSSDVLPRRTLEALLVDECVRGHISRGKVAEILGLSFYETEELFANRHVPYPARTQKDDGISNSSK